MYHSQLTVKFNFNLLLFSSQYGYADLGHKARGLHLRQFSRTFIVDDGDDVINTRVVYVVAEITMVTHALRQGVSYS